MEKNRTVMTFGTFDMFHPGHAYYLSEARKLGDRLITVVARDATVEAVKGKKAREPESTRLQKVRESALVDEAVLGSLSDHYAIILEKKPDILCFGYDQHSFNGPGLMAFLEKNDLQPQMVTLDPFEPETWKSSKL